MRTLFLLPVLLLLASCAAPGAVPKDSPSSPPLLRVHDASTGAIVTMDAETYLAGVVAGEMPSSWPMEALRAQAILARTFMLKFISEKESRYPGADISTDITEAQAYNADAIDNRIRQAVASTRGMVLLDQHGTLPYAWFHAHSGGMTESAVDGLDWQGGEPGYTRIAPGLESPDAPASVRQWNATFTEEEFLDACRQAGCPADQLTALSIARRGRSGRAVTLNVSGLEVNAARLRISLGSTVMRSTFLTRLTFDQGLVYMEGRGYGHGVGMPQWGARALADQGRKGEEIALHYYRDLTLHRAW